MAIDGRSPTRAVATARERTLAAASARAELRIDHSWDPRMPRTRRGGLLRPLTPLAKAAGKRALAAATRRFDPRHLSAEGVIDFRRRRYALDFGSAARLYADGKGWDGRSGRRLSTLPPDERALPTPLWLLDVLAGLTEASDAGTEGVRGASCRRISGTVDLSRASAATPGGVAAPAVARFEELLALPVAVWIDDEHVRRVRVPTEQRTDTVELWDFGVSLDDLDWTRLPTFRSPQEAAAVAKARARADAPPG